MKCHHPTLVVRGAPLGYLPNVWGSQYRPTINHCLGDEEEHPWEGL